MSNFNYQVVLAAVLALFFGPFAMQEAWHTSCREAFPTGGEAQANCILEPYNK
jgi:hypothetical protein